MSSTSKSSSEKSLVAPIFIPIGPQASGKTTLLSSKDLFSKHSELQKFSSLSSSTVTDIAIDDQEGVYIQIPTNLFLTDTPHQIKKQKIDNKEEQEEEEEITITPSSQELLNTVLHDKSISDRLYDDSNHEMRWVLQRLYRKLSKKEFKKKIRKLYPKNDGAMSCRIKQIQNYGFIGDDHLGGNEKNNNDDSESDLAEYLIEAVESVRREGSKKDITKEADLFILEGIFKSGGSDNNTSRLSAIQAAESKLKHIATSPAKKNVPLAWGNTNTKATDYQVALHVGQQSGRPIFFIPFANKEKLKITEGDDENQNDDGLFLPRIKLQELILRSIQRLYKKGRYVPVRAIVDTCLRVDQMMSGALLEMEKNSSQHNDVVASSNSTTKRFTKFQLDSELAKLAGFQLNMDRTVTATKNNNHTRFQRGGGGRGYSRTSNQGHSRGGGGREYSRGGNRNGRGRGDGRGDGRGRGRVDGRGMGRGRSQGRSGTRIRMPGEG